MRCGFRCKPRYELGLKSDISECQFFLFTFILTNIFVHGLNKREHNFNGKSWLAEKKYKLWQSRKSGERQKSGEKVRRKGNGDVLQPSCDSTVDLRSKNLVDNLQSLLLQKKKLRFFFLGTLFNFFLTINTSSSTSYSLSVKE